MSNDQPESEGVYYRCMCGPNAHVALGQPDSFTVEDHLGRSWSCHPVQTKVLDYMDLLADPPELDGEVGEEKTIVRIVYCTDAGDVRTKLAKSS